MLFPDMQGEIADVIGWMDATRVPLGTEAGHAKGAVRNIIGLARLAGGDMEHVEKVIAGYLARAWRSTGCEQAAGTGMTPLFTEAEAARVCSGTQRVRI
jgi:hypothetical protein